MYWHIPSGEVAYEVHTNGYLLQQVNSAISLELNETFEGVWLLVVYWNNVNGALNNEEVSCLLCLNAFGQLWGRYTKHFKGQMWLYFPCHSPTATRRCWWQTAPSPIACSSITVTFSKHIMQPLASQPLVTSSTAIDCLSRTIPMRLPAATDLTVTGTLCSMPYTMMVGSSVCPHFEPPLLRHPMMILYLCAITVGPRPYIVTVPEGPIFQAGINVVCYCNVITPGSFTYLWRVHCLASGSEGQFYSYITPKPSSITVNSCPLNCADLVRCTAWDSAGATGEDSVLMQFTGELDSSPL